MSISSLLLVAAALQLLQDPVGPPTALRVEGAIRVDGMLDDAAWASASRLAALTQREPAEGAPATEASDVRLAYDDDALYLAARLDDAEPTSIQALLSRRDRDIRGDRFLLYLDPYHDKRTGFYFGVNAAGTQFDGTLLNDDWDDSTWDGVWQSAVQRTATGWQLELRIPLSQLRFVQRDPMTWGVNVQRFIARKGERAYLAPPKSDASGFVSRFLVLQGLAGVRPKRRMELLPYLTQRLEQLNVATGNPFNDGSRLLPGAGLDAKLGLGANLTLDATVNPDFGQVEVDPAVVNLSDTEVFFNERRPFFVEGQNIFNFGIGGANDYWSFNWSGPSLLYSRRIGRRPQGALPTAAFADAPAGTHILGALKLTGKVRGWNLGVLGAATKREYARFSSGAEPAGRLEIEPLSGYGVLRAQRELNGGRQGFGILATRVQRSFADDALRTQLAGAATTLGADGWTFLDAERSWALTGWVAASEVRGDRARLTALQQNPVHYFQRPDASHLRVDSLATSLRGFAGRVALNKQKGNVLANAAVGVIDPGFETNDIGFQARTDIVNAHAGAGYRWTVPTQWYRRVSIIGATYANWDFEGNRTATGVFTNGNIQFLNFARTRWRLGAAPWSTINTRRTRGGPLTLSPAGVEYGVGADTDDRALFRAGGDVYGYNAAERAARNWGVSVYGEWKPNPRLLLRVSPSYNHDITSAQYVTAASDPLATATFGRRYLFGDLDQHTLSASIRANWIFSPTLSLEVFAQPLVSSGRYRLLRELAAPRSFSFTDYSEAPGTSGPRYDRAAGLADPDGDGPAAAIRVANPDFTFASLRGNAVLRWEYGAGSTLFVVWTQNRAESDGIGSFRPGAAFGDLLGTKADNIFLVKATYWLSR